MHIHNIIQCKTSIVIEISISKLHILCLIFICSSNLINCDQNRNSTSLLPLRILIPSTPSSHSSLQSAPGYKNKCEELDFLKNSQPPPTF